MALLIGGSTRAIAQQIDGPHGDTQFWPDVQLSVNLRPRINFVFFGTIRSGHNISAIVDKQIGAGFNFKLGKYFSLSPNYRYLAAKPTSTRRTQEHRVFVDLTMRVPLGLGFSLSDRHRGEWRNVESLSFGRYRNRLQIERTLTLHDHKLTPYLADEINYDGRYHAWVRNRVYVGARLPVQKHLTLDSYYCKQNDGRARPGYLHLVGLIFRIEL